MDSKNANELSISDTVNQLKVSLHENGRISRDDTSTCKESSAPKQLVARILPKLVIESVSCHQNTG